MTDQEIIEALGLSQSSEESQQSMLTRIDTVVELRMLNIMGELVTPEVMDQLEKMEQEGASKRQMLDWLSENVADADQMREALTRDYVVEVNDKLADLEN